MSNVTVTFYNTVGYLIIKLILNIGLKHACFRIIVIIKSRY